MLHDPTTYGEGDNFGIKLAYDKAGKKIAIDQAITENWSTGATIGLMPQVNAIKAAGLKCVVVWLTPQDQAAFVQDLHSVGYDATVFGIAKPMRRHVRKERRRPGGRRRDCSAHVKSSSPEFPELKAFREEYAKAFNVEVDAVCRNELRQHHDACAGRRQRQLDRACRAAKGVQQHQRLQRHHRRPRIFAKTITADQINVGQIQGFDQGVG